MIYPRRILALDLETTGLSSQYDYITQVAAAVMEGGECVCVPFYSQVQPNLAKFKISLEALAVQTGDIREKEGQKAASKWFAQIFDYPEPKQVSKDLKDWLEAHDAKHLPVVAHNAAFDHAFLNQFQFNNRLAFGKEQFLSPTWIDTIALAKWAMPGGDSYFLDSLLCALKLPPRPSFHDALQDAILAGRAYHLLCEALGLYDLTPTLTLLQSEPDPSNTRQNTCLTTQ